MHMESTTEYTASQAVSVSHRRLVILAVALLALAALFWPTLWSMIAIWWRSDTFAHGFLVFPISAYLVWRRRHVLATLPQQPDLRALPVLLLLGLVWTVARITDVLVVQQLIFIAMVPAMVWLILGWRGAYALLFPLGFLIFAVPFGEALIYPMMQFTAAFTVQMLRLTGIPVFWEGTFFSIPSGDWSVVEGCSGVRYLIASIFLGVLYAYMMYYTFWRRALLVSLAVIFPIIANGLRAYMIVMIAHLSDMKLALGVDHFIYGWVFFGIVMFLLFWIGALWRERESAAATGDGQHPDDNRAKDRGKPIGALVLGLAALAVWPAWAAYLDHRTAAPTTVELATPEPVPPWVRTSSFTEWKPRYVGPTVEHRVAYTDGRSKVGVYLAYYGAQEQGAELVNSQNVMVAQRHPVWRMTKQYTVDAQLDDRGHRVIESQVKSEQQNLLVWHWYWVAGDNTSSPYIAKLREAFAKLFGRYEGGAGIVIFTPMESDPKPARAALRRYAQRLLPSIADVLGGAVRVARTSVSSEADD